jgi:hypothetical protein
MNKSTPLSQLPSTPSQGNFVNDQQRQMITQAQQAIQTSTFPQNTQISADIINDDDPTIQEVLNQFNSPSPQPSLPENPNINYLQQQQVMAQMQQQQQQQQQLYAQMQQQQQIDSILPQLQSQMVSPTLNNVIIKGYLTNLTDDIKLVALVFIIYIVVNFIPIESIISRYFSIDKIPYHQIILRALLAALLFMFLKKIIT